MHIVIIGQNEEGVEPCTRKECVAIVRRILETQGRNKAERNDILGTEDMLMHELTGIRSEMLSIFVYYCYSCF